MDVRVAVPDALLAAEADVFRVQALGHGVFPGGGESGEEGFGEDGDGLLEVVELAWGSGWAAEAGAVTAGCCEAGLAGELVAAEVGPAGGGGAAGVSHVMSPGSVSGWDCAGILRMVHRSYWPMPDQSRGSGPPCASHGSPRVL